MLDDVILHFNIFEKIKNKNEALLLPPNILRHHKNLSLFHQSTTHNYKKCTEKDASYSSSMVAHSSPLKTHYRAVQSDNKSPSQSKYQTNGNLHKTVRRNLNTFEYFLLSFS